MKIFKEKKELPVFVVAILIFFSSLGFLAFAIYYIVFLPVPTVIQSLKVRILTTVQLEEAKEGYQREKELTIEEGEDKIEAEIEIESEGAEEENTDEKEE